jgi:natural product biosynthesis luciferase-like monooxygenase protein
MSDLPLTAILVGNESLLIQCGQRVIAGGGVVTLVVSEDPAIIRWAAEAHVAHARFGPDLPPRLGPGAVDFLLSIGNLRVLSAEWLAVARHAAINFHDGPLPHYRGLHVTSWALINRESTHGITWHIASPEVDQGGTLEQELFDVSPDDTALTLNAKCYEAGLAAFDRLLSRMRDRRLETRSAPDDIGRYYGRRQRPAAAGHVDWRRPPEDCDALIRALDFGWYANPLGLPWSLRNGRPVRVDRQTHGQLTRGELPAFDVLDTSLAARISERHEAWCDREPRWVRHLSSLLPPELPVAGSGPARRESATAVSSGRPKDGMSVAATIGVWLARTLDQPVLDIGCRGPRLAQQLAGLDAWFEPLPPVRIAVDVDRPVGACVGDVEASLRSHDDHGSFLKDIGARYPELRGRSLDDIAQLLGVAVVISDHAVEFGDQITLGVRVTEDGRTSHWSGDPSRLRAPVATVAARYSAFEAFVLSSPEAPASAAPTVEPAEREWLVTAAAFTSADLPPSDDVVRQFEAQAVHSPDVDAVVACGERLTYGELNQKANRLARALQSRGIGRGAVVGLHIARTQHLLPAVLGVLKTGAAYLPLDPLYPADRLRFMVADSGAALVLSQADHVAGLGDVGTEIATLETLAPELDALPVVNLAMPVAATDLIYLIYTSGSTGRPKGVMLEHGNVASFFSAMDGQIDYRAGGTWLAVTSLSFDISVLELLWTLCRGFTVVLHADAGAATGQSARQPAINLSLFYFSSDESATGTDRYRLLMDGARFADEHGFEAVWTPERHFHAFGGLYPNPAITSAAVAAVTHRVAVRAGSLVMPLHHPVRAAEDWSLVDNLSNGRVGVAFASGWNPNDFVFAPHHHAVAKQVTFEGLDTVRRLWRGDAVTFKGPHDRDVVVRTLPRPVQPELPFWITTAGNPETFAQAGAVGGNVLTHLLGQTIEEVAAKIRAYRQARRQAGHQGGGRVTLMLHTFVGESDDDVREIVRGPMKQYLASSLNLVKPHAWSFPAFKGRRVAPDASTDDLFNDLSPADLDALLEHSFSRYFETGGLFGSVATCLATVQRLQAIGVDEVACLIDFGVPADQVLASLPRLAAVRRQAVERPADDGGPTVAEAIEGHDVTHLQCTPSMASMIVNDSDGVAALGRLSHLLVGGEALSVQLAARLRATGVRRVTNMYGPTETTIWSLTHDLARDEAPVPIGRPIAGTRAYVLDRHGELVPHGLEGELYLGGPGVARGYHDRPELTHERFVPDRFGDRPGARLYRTGDRARLRDDGAFEFVGRMDQQVKVRGHRIELGEIEAELQRAPGVVDAAVVLREDTPGDQRLIAYVTVAGGAPAREVWQDALRQRLPEVMVPSTFVVLDALPLTPNGKIDRKALPHSIPTDRALSPATLAPPQDDVQRHIASIWQEVLRTDAVGIDDNFFDLGGHSLLTLQIAQRVGTWLGRPLPITDLFRFPTIRGLATHLSGAPGASAPSGVAVGDERAAARRAARGRRQDK